MRIYNLFMAPLELLLLGRARREIIPQAAGDVLEIGTGNGANFSYYDYDKITSFTSLDITEPDLSAAKYPIKSVIGSIEKLPFSEASFDCVIETLVLCSADLEKSINEVKRVLKPGGLFVFMEHVRPKGRIIGSLADRLNPLWRKVASGCNINKKTDTILMNSGFTDVQIKQKGVFRYGSARVTRPL